MTSKQFPNQVQPQPRVRTLKIEAAGDAWQNSIKPKIRLVGRWLEMAGFKPGEHVQVVCTAPGVMELRCLALPAANEMSNASRVQADLALL